ncbi:hypothetical protein CV102_22715 [Natronococcus pandeyae]|uniref:Nucleotidyltransferase family protein n=1 Tax=Natronococcus pandeyae TaxID=2055836 RepID=A0A8J8Q110_9EURY|nr:nucleotidyltransferase family protein [Natronococcus pandeyae]TYL36438.1 hypothetical protein CV102_22715 [Natronococcus pandeyae]
MTGRIKEDTSVRPEAALLIQCSRPIVDADAKRRIEQLIRSDVEWEYLRRIARFHGLLPALYQRLARTCADSVPSAQLAMLQADANQITGRTLQLTRELLDLLEQCEAHGIDAVPFKGPILSVSAYGDVGRRDFRDLDLLVRRTDVSKTITMLRVRGYEPASQISTERLSALFQFDHEYELFHSADNIHVGLHWQIADDDYLFPVHYQSVADRLEQVRMGGRSIQVLPKTDRIIALCVHGTKHRWGRLLWVADIAGLTQNWEVSWGAILDRARQLHKERILLLGMRLANVLYRIELPEAVRERLNAHSAVDSLVAEARATFLHSPLEWPNYFDRSWYYIRAHERRMDRARCAGRLLLSPEKQDVEFASDSFDLDEWHYLIRPVRILFDLVPVDKPISR